MCIDQYDHSFSHLVTTDLPRHMEELKENMRNPKLMREFSSNGIGVAGLRRKFDLEEDFPGCYMLLDEKEPVYVGISRAVLQRLRQHVRGQTHFDASLAYRIAAQHMPHEHTRGQAMKTDEFKKQFNNAQDYLRNLKVAYVKILNPLVLYVFEPYCAMEFGTSQWNTFRTH